MSIDLEADAKALQVDNNSLSAVADLGKQAQVVQLEIDDLEASLKERKESLKNLLEVRIPEACQEIGLMGFSMDDGSEVEIKQFYSASITAEKEAEAHAWLRDNGYDDIIKNVVSVQFGKEEDAKAGETLQLLRREGLLPDQVAKVHPQTLKGWVREMIEQGVHFPMETFGVYTGFKATIKSKKR
jgi:hypothetical protein